MSNINERGNAIGEAIRSDQTGKIRKQLKKREAIQKQTEKAKEEIEEKHKRRKLHTVQGQQFGSSAADVLEEEFKKQTIGLVSAEEFQKKRLAVDELILKAEAQKNAKAAKPSTKVIQHVQKNQLSFGGEEDDSDSDSDEDDEQSDDAGATKATSSSKKKPLDQPEVRSKKNPTVDTSFMHDEAREKEKEEQRQRLMEEYKALEAKQKKEMIDITYSYWDGSGHRRSLSIEKGATIGQFLKVARSELLNNFAELRHVASEDLIFVKEDLMLPHHLSFYELIRDKARGKSGPLFAFGVSEGHDAGKDADARVERAETHAAKIVDRQWYERHKHVFPQSRWEKYDPSKSYEKYSIKGNAEKHKVAS